MHGANNYPLFKARSRLDIELPDRTTNETYLNVLSENLPMVFRHEPEIVFYLAGADPYEADKLGKLSLTIDGLRARDEMVLRECYEREIPVTTVMSGGYGKQITDTVEIHCNTIRTVKEVFETPIRCESFFQAEKFQTA
jgi:acetoin utilization deacetylase AcuC-like enzyme